MFWIDRNIFIQRLLSPLNYSLWGVFAKMQNPDGKKLNEGNHAEILRIKNREILAAPEMVISGTGQMCTGVKSLCFLYLEFTFSAAKLKTNCHWKIITTALKNLWYTILSILSLWPLFAHHDYECMKRLMRLEDMSQGPGLIYFIVLKLGDSKLTSIFLHSPGSTYGEDL